MTECGRHVARNRPTSTRAVKDALITTALSGTADCGGRVGCQEPILAMTAVIVCLR